MSEPAIQPSVVIIDYENLLSEGFSSAVFDKIASAYGEDGLGILCVRGVPGYPKSRANLLPLARGFAALDDSIKVSVYTVFPTATPQPYRYILIDLSGEIRP
jgi:hypothetical protein